MNNPQPDMTRDETQIAVDVVLDRINQLLTWGTITDIERRALTNASNLIEKAKANAL